MINHLSSSGDVEHSCLEKLHLDAAVGRPGIEIGSLSFVVVFADDGYLNFVGGYLVSQMIGRVHSFVGDQSYVEGVELLKYNSRVKLVVESAVVLQEYLSLPLHLGFLRYNSWVELVDGSVAVEVMHLSLLQH